MAMDYVVKIGRRLMSFAELLQSELHVQWQDGWFLFFSIEVELIPVQLLIFDRLYKKVLSEVRAIVPETV